MSITANGSYDAMRGFVQAVQGINRIAVPEDVTYTLDKGGDATKNNVTINCKIWSLLLNNDTVEERTLPSSDKQYIKNDSLLIHYMGAFPHSREAPYVSSHILMCFHSVLASICRSSPSEIT